MSPEIIAIIGTGSALAAVILPEQLAMRCDIAGLHRAIADLRERMTWLAGLLACRIRVGLWQSDAFTLRGR